MKQPPEHKIYTLPECRIWGPHYTGGFNVSVNEVWVSAMFTSLLAIASWAEDWDGAEKEFARLNPPNGKGSNLLGIKDSK